MDYKKMMAAARKKNAQFDRIDRKHGNKPPASCGPRELLRTAMTAISTGIATDSFDCVAEGQAMLEQLDALLSP